MNITSYNQPVSIDLPTAAQTYVIPASQLGANGLTAASRRQS